jgi:putative heme iron utilization protein
MQRHPRVSLLVMAEAGDGVQPQALPRVSLQAHAATLVAGDDHDKAKEAYLARFPSAALTFELADFSIVALQPVSARLVAGFGRAYGLTGGALTRWLLG